MRAVHNICLLSVPQKLVSTAAASAASFFSMAACRHVSVFNGAA